LYCLLCAKTGVMQQQTITATIAKETKMLCRRFIDFPCLPPGVNLLADEDSSGGISWCLCFVVHICDPFRNNGRLFALSILRHDAQALMNCGLI
jgi:hypothetical protein